VSKPISSTFTKMRNEKEMRRNKELVGKNCTGA